MRTQIVLYCNSLFTKHVIHNINKMHNIFKIILLIYTTLNQNIQDALDAFSIFFIYIMCHLLPTTPFDRWRDSIQGQNSQQQFILLR
jgi:hypothetical protein